MNIGERNRRIEIWQPTGGKDAANEPLANAWALFKSKWAHVRGESGLGTIRSAASAGGIHTPLDRYSFRVNYDPSITVKMQVREHDGTQYNIVAVRHDKAHRNWTDIVAETGGANA